MSAAITRGYVGLGLVNPKHDCNVGSILRLAYNFDCAFVAYTGKRYRKHGSDTQKAWRHIPLFRADDLKSIIPYDCVPIAIEINGKAKSIVSFNHPQRAFYIFGPEDGSVTKELLSFCRHVLYVPTTHCMNLAVTAGVVLYDRLNKHLTK